MQRRQLYVCFPANSFVAGESEKKSDARKHYFLEALLCREVNVTS